VFWHENDLLADDGVVDLVGRVRPSHLLHLAWVTQPGEYWTSPANLLWVEKSLRLVEAFTLVDGRRAVFAGTCAEYDWSHGYLSEHVTPLNPSTLYGKSKHAFRIAVEADAARAGLSTAWGRLFFLYGPHENPDRFVPTMIRSMLRGEAAACRNARQMRDFLYCEDAADALVSLLHSDVRGPVNIASGRSVALGDIVRTLEKLVGPDALATPGLDGPCEEEPLYLVADVSRLRTELRWTPRHDLRGGLERSIQWWRSQLTAVAN
jgi:nucleoside-diphosphate-sugar epimerase